ncbi:hypothetical protein HDU67_006053 [Dinochytrium kinnereticum]|nr:hypothetical protein HDU67_006053 [Dinochytrium kinnereticum]
MLTAAFAPAPVSVDPSLAPESHSANPFRPIEGLGCLLRFAGIEGKVWTGSVLILQAINKLVPQLKLFDGPKETAVEGFKIDTYGGYDFIRYDLSVSLGPAGKKIEYQVAGRDRQGFYVPAADRESKIAFYSCNGFGGDAKDPEQNWGGIQPMWADLLRRHQEDPFHVQIGGGDQLYADDIWKDVPLLADWLETPDIHLRFKTQWTYEHEKSLSDFYLLAYAYHFQEAEFGKALATIPYTFMCDDHDILDGFGSYPDYIRESQIMQNSGRIAYRFFLLFQQHQSLSGAEKDPSQALFPAPAGYSWLKKAGPSTIILGIDNRSSRTETKVLSDECWSVLWTRVEAALEKAKASGSPMKHLYVVASVPVVYPRMVLADNIINTVSSFQNSLRSVVRTVGKSVESLSASMSSLLKTENVLKGNSSTSLGKHVIGSFGQPELKDDLLDEWTHLNHIDERNAMVRNLQEFADRFRVRVSFLSGDVHICGYGRFRSENSDDANFINDHRGMVQVISSAIGNNPPPSGILTYLHTNKRVLDAKACGIPDTAEEMLETFKKDIDGKDLKNSWLLNRRNWSSFTVNDDYSLNVIIHVENLDRNQDAMRYPLLVPMLK